MERPKTIYEQPIDDHELTKAQQDTIALSDELLTHKPENSLTFVDIVLAGDHNAMLAEIEAGPLNYLLASPQKQLAYESDGEYYPKLDVRKEFTTYTGMSLRVWGWDDEKVRRTNHQTQPPYDLTRYPGEIDKTRQLELGMCYAVGDEHVTESLSLYASTAQPGFLQASSKIFMTAYMEQGYEGHGGKSDIHVRDEAVEWLLDFVAKHVGDQPQSAQEYHQEVIDAIRQKAEQHGVLEAVDELIAATWNAQAIYLMRRPCKLLDGSSVAQCLDDPERAAQAAEAARAITRRWQEGR